LSWPTPQAHDQVGGKTPEQVQVMRERTGAGVSNLNEAVAFWPTPSAMNPNDGQAPEAYNRRRRRLQEKHRNGNGAGLVLAQAAQQWPTASATDFKMSAKIGQRRGQLSEAILWATATATDAKASGMAGYAARRPGFQGVTLTDQACRGLLAPLTEPGGKPTSTGGLRLSPLFVEALMGFPIGFTDCDCLETPSSLPKPLSPGESCGSD
jgi:hypothetical protein